MWFWMRYKFEKKPFSRVFQSIDDKMYFMSQEISEYKNFNAVNLQEYKVFSK